MLPEFLTFAPVFASFSLYQLWKTCTFVQAFSSSIRSESWLPAVSIKLICKQKRVAPSTPRSNAPFSRKAFLGLFHLSRDPHQDHRAKKRNDNLSDQAVRSPSKLNTKPPTTPPRIPRTMSITTPYPPPFITFPASQPAINPTTIQ
jgi:hypothetical protein